MRYLLGYAVLTFHLNGQVKAACKDFQGHTYDTGIYYVPGPEPCTLCVCDHGNPKWCKAVICQLPEKQGCKSFRFGTACCEFICLDDTLSAVSNDKTDGNAVSVNDNGANYDLGLRLVASCITAILSLALLFFLVHRLRRRKIRGRQNRQLNEDQTSLGSMGYLERGGLPHGVQLDDMACAGGYPLWKPPGHYFPGGEAPPPYEEAVAAARAEALLSGMNSHAFSSAPRIDLSTPFVTPARGSSGNGPNGGQSCMTAPPSISSRGSINVRSSTDDVTSGLYNAASGTISSAAAAENANPTSFSMIRAYENLPLPILTPQHSRQMNRIDNQHHQQPQQLNPHLHHHTTLPRQTSAFTISASLPNSSISSHRTIPRTLATTANLRLRRDLIGQSFNPSPINNNTSLEPRSAPPIIPSASTDIFSPPIVPVPPEVPTTSAETEAKQVAPALGTAQDAQEGSFDSVTCTCSVQALPTLHDDADDYRSECENCKSATGSRYYLDNEDELVTSPHETMTLHRRPEEAAANVTPQYYRTSLTLPTSTRQRSRSTGARGNWFSSMPESSTESSDED